MKRESALADALIAQHPYPVLGEEWPPAAYWPLDLGIHNPDFLTVNVLTYEGLEAYIRCKLQQNRAAVAYGGYGEHRIFYDQSPLFNNGQTAARCIHLGLDLWAPTGAKVYAPLQGRVHSFRYNDQVLDYGATIILTHELQEQVFHTLYGHLSLESLAGLTVGMVVAKGEAFASLGARHENGGWVPHLHLQVILDMEGREGDFPGVVAKADAARYMAICPDPISFLPFLNRN